MSEPLVVDDVRARRSRVGGRSRLAFLFAVFGVFAGILAFSAATHALEPILLGLPLFVLVAIVLFRRRGRDRGEERGTLRLENGAITIDGATVVQAKDIESAWVSPHTATTKIVLRPKGILDLPVELFVHRETNAREIVRALGLDVDQTTVRQSVRSPVGGGVIAPAILLSQTVTFRTFLASHGLPTSWSVPVFIAAMMAWAFAAAKSRTVTIGRDGIRIAWLAWKRFIPHASIERVESAPYSIVLHLKNGERIPLRIHPSTRKPMDDWRDEVLAFADRIERARAREDEGAPMAPIAVESSTRDWIASVRRGDRIDTFREGAPLDDAQLWRLVEDGGVDPTQRAAAGVVLSRALDDDKRARLRVAAQASAEPKLRVALEAAADEDEPSMAKAMDRLRRR